MNKIFLDCGAHKGDPANHFMKSKFYENSYKIYSFEANPKFANIKRADNVLFYPVAVWVKDGEIDFYVGNSLSSSLIRSKKSGNLNFNNPIKIKCIDFSKWVSENIKNDDYVILNMDIEGAEYDVLSKMINDGTINLIDKLFVEFHFNKIEVTKDVHNSLVSQLKNIFDNNLAIYPGQKFKELNPD